jgi:phosphohistidine phosphatase
VKQLYLLRHAKSSWDDPALDDHERPLAPRGRKAAKAVASWLAAHDMRPQLVLCSTSTRTRQTLDRVLPALGDPEVVFEDGLYHASADELLRRVQAIPDEVDETLLVGHNPGLQDLALLLASSGPLRERLAGKLPTGALVTLAVDASSWRELVAGTATVESYVTPRELA